MERFDPYYHWFGIPPKDQPPNAYRLLAVERFESDPDVIEAAAEQRMLLLRTRQAGEHAADSQRLLNEISQAVRLLLDPARKQAYDAELRGRAAPSAGNQARKPAPPAARTPPVARAIPAPIGTAVIEPAPCVISPLASTTRAATRPRRAPGAELMALGGAALALLLIGVAAVMWNRGTPEPLPSGSKRPHRAMRLPTETTSPELSTTTPPAEQQSMMFVPAVPLDTIAGPVESIEEENSLPNPESVAPPPREAVANAPPPSDVEPEGPVVATSAENSAQKRVLELSDLKYAGAFKLPQQALERSTGYAAGCLAVRRVEGRVRLFCDTHVHSGGLIYEIAVPALAKQEPFPAAEIVREWGDIYQGRKQKANGESYELNELIPTTGLRWDESGRRLWWTYGEKYNTENQTAPTIGATRIERDKATAEGPWRLEAPQSWQRGGTLEIPAWFAKKHTNGRRLGVGFGGYYSIFEGGSYGPTLLAADDPLKAGEGKSPGHQVVLGYPSPNYCVRNANYSHAEESWLGRNPVGDKGTWNATDEIGGEIGAAGAIWIDTPRVHGLMFFASLGTGDISYSDGGVQSQGRENALYVYNPHDLGKAIQKKEASWSPVPKHYPLENPVKGWSGRAAGTAYDSVDGRLYVAWTFAYQEGEERYPVVIAYDIPR